MAGMVNGVYQVWTTEDECAYIAGMGTYAPGAPADPASIPVERRIAALDRYLASIHTRARWDGMSYAAVRAFAETARERLLTAAGTSAHT